MKKIDFLDLEFNSGIILENTSKNAFYRYSFNSIWKKNEILF